MDTPQSKLRVTTAGRDQTNLVKAQGTAQDLLTIIEQKISHHPRSQQKRIGPSEIGMECKKRLAHKLAGTPEPDDGRIPWIPAIGTAMHTQMETWFSSINDFLPGTYLIEQRVSVGRIGDTEITGSTDLFIPDQATVVDWKFVGDANLKKYRAHGPSQQYRVQAHLYGKGWAAAGYTVERVMIAFLPRGGSLDEAYWWWEPYDPMTAILALAEANQLYAAIQQIGVEAVAAGFAPCTQRFCPWCGPAQKLAAAQQADMFAA